MEIIVTVAEANLGLYLHAVCSVLNQTVDSRVEAGKLADSVRVDVSSLWAVVVIAGVPYIKPHFLSTSWNSWRLK